MALDASITTVGSKQGAFKGSNPLKGRAGTSIVTRCEWSGAAPRDAHSGLSTGKRQYEPVVVTMPADAAMVNYKTALATNETLTKVTINFYQPATQQLAQAGSSGGSGGETKPHMTIELANAVAQKVEFLHPDTRSADPDVKNREISIRVSFTYMQITTTWTEGGKTFTDNFTDPT